MKENTQRRINFLQKDLRIILKRGLSPVFPNEIIDTPYPFQEGTGLARAIELNQQGYGLLFDISHFGYSDLPQAVAATDFGIKELLDKKLLIGAAAHQIKPGIPIITKLSGVKVCPIVTTDTLHAAVLKGKDTSSLKLNQGMSDFVKNAAIYLENGNHVLVAAQGGRRSTLFPSVDENSNTPKMPRTIATLFKSLEKNKVTKFAYMPIGLGIFGEQDYSRENVGRYNLFRKYRIIRGLTFTRGEIMQAVDGDYGQIDEYLTCMKANLVPEAYLNIFDPETTISPRYSI